MMINHTAKMLAMSRKGGSISSEIEIHIHNIRRVETKTLTSLDEGICRMKTLSTYCETHLDMVARHAVVGFLSSLPRKPTQCP